MSIELPFPAKILWPNGRPGHWAQVRREFKKHKGWAQNAMCADRSFKYEGGRVDWSATFYPKTRNRIDADNAAASLKAYQDGIAAAIGADDSNFNTPTIHFAEPVKNGRVVITIGEGV